MDDDLYNLFAPNLTVSPHPRINVNTMKEATLKALFPQATKEEIEKFFKYRDSEEEDGTFKTEDDFFKYIQGNVQVYNRGDTLWMSSRNSWLPNNRCISSPTRPSSRSRSRPRSISPRA